MNLNRTHPVKATGESGKSAGSSSFGREVLQLPWPKFRLIKPRSAKIAAPCPRSHRRARQRRARCGRSPGSSTPCASIAAAAPRAPRGSRGRARSCRANGRSRASRRNSQVACAAPGRAAPRRGGSRSSRKWRATAGPTHIWRSCRGALFQTGKVENWALYSSEASPQTDETCEDRCNRGGKVIE
jgi:hypothetical protein